MKNRWSMLLAILLACFFAGACAHAPISETPSVKTYKGADKPDSPRVLILYQSTYGSTRQYAGWINRDIPSELVDLEKGDKPEFAGYDVIVFGGSIRMGRIVIAPLILETWNAVRGKTVVLFTTSGTPPQHPNIQKIYTRSFPENMRKEMRYFPLGGRMVRKELGFFDYFLVAVGRMIEKDEGLRKLMSDDYDEVKPENLAPLLEYIKGSVSRK